MSALKSSGMAASELQGRLQELALEQQQLLPRLPAHPVDGITAKQQIA